MVQMVLLSYMGPPRPALPPNLSVLKKDEGSAVLWPRFMHSHDHGSEMLYALCIMGLHWYCFHATAGISSARNLPFRVHFTLVEVSRPSVPSQQA